RDRGPQGRRAGGAGDPRRDDRDDPAVNGVHDMGGMHGLGPVEPEPQEPVFHHRWEGRVHAMTIASPTRGNIDAGRHQRELIPGADYLRMSYYEKWFTSLCALLAKAGLATPGE